MVQRVTIYLFILFLVVVLSACSEQQEKDEEAAPAFLDVKLSVLPEQGKVNEPVIFEAKVTYGEKEVTDADSVEFEIWRSKNEHHERIEVKHKENGIYQLEKSFIKEGTYYIIAHVTAEKMRNMPKEKFVIGHPSEFED